MESSAVQMLVAARRVADYAKELGIDVNRFEIRPAYNHMGALLADSILQAGLKYHSVVRPRILTILTDYPDLSRTSNLIKLVERRDTSAFLNWTHQEKVDRFEALVLFLGDASVEHVDDLKGALQDSEFATALRGVRGIGPKTVDYMGCLVGMESIAVDRHVRTFAKRVGVMEDDYEFLKMVFCYAADLLSVPRREFDAWVWQREASLTRRQLALAF